MMEKINFLLAYFLLAKKANFESVSWARIGREFKALLFMAKNGKKKRQMMMVRMMKG